MTGIIEMKFVHSLKSCVSTALVIGLIACSGALAEERPLPERAGPPVKTTAGVPHVQLGVQPAPEVNAAFLHRIAALPNVEIRPTVVSLPGAQGFWLLDDLPLARPDVIFGGREFAHVHQDGSLHASLPPERAREPVA
jgi:phospholipase/carboxylesterase